MKRAAVSAGSDNNGNGSFTAQIKIHKTFTMLPRFDHITNEPIIGICYKDYWNNYYRPKTAMAEILKGDLTLND